MVKKDQWLKMTGEREKKVIKKVIRRGGYEYGSIW